MSKKNRIVRADYGMLMGVPSHLLRQNFMECCKLIGVQVNYSYPDKSKHYTTNGELKSNGYSEPKKVWCIVNHHVDQKTAKLLGWDAELDQEALVISLPYDLEHLQVGALVEIPSAIDVAQSRLFRIAKLSTIMLYPASVSCEVVPEYADTAAPVEIELFTNNNFTLLEEG